MNRVHQCLSLAAGALLGAAGAVVGMGAAQPETTPSRQPGSQPGTPGMDKDRPYDPSRQPGHDLNKPGMGNQFGIPMRGEKLTQELTDKVTGSWSADSKKAVQQIVAKYGQPDGATYDSLCWHNPGQWKKLVVTNMEVQHNFPIAHKDCVLGFLDMKVPADKFNDLAKFDGSIFAWRTAGEICAACNTEEMDILALNLAHDVIDGSKSVEDARDALSKAAMAYQQGTKDPLTQDFKFDVQSGNTGDPDQGGRGGSTPDGLTKPNRPGGP